MLSPECHPLTLDASVSPRNVRVIAVSSVVLSVQWDGLTPCRHVNGHIVKYRILYTSESTGVVQSVDKSGSWDVMSEIVFLSGLTPNTNYTIKVAAVNDKGHVGLYSKPIAKCTTELGMSQLFGYTCRGMLGNYVYINFTVFRCSKRYCSE